MFTYPTPLYPFRTFFTQFTRGLLFAAMVLGSIPAFGDLPSLLESRSDRHVNVVGVLPLEEEAVKDRILIIFDRTLQPIPQPDRDVLTIIPPLDGQLQLGPNYVAFLPTEVTPDQIFHLQMGPALRSTDGLEINPAHREISIASTPFLPKRVAVLREQPGGVLLVLFLPYSVDIETLKQYLEILSKSGGSVPYELAPGDNDKSPRITISNFSDWPITLTVKKGLPDRTGRFHSLRDFVQTYPRRDLLQVLDVHWYDFTPELQRILISFTKLVEPTDLQKYLTITDTHTGETIPCTLERGEFPLDHLARISLQCLDNIRLEVSVAEGLPGEMGTALPGAYTTVLEAQFQPLQIVHTFWNDFGERGSALHINFNHNLQRYISPREFLAHLRIEPEVPGLEAEYSSWSTSEFDLFGDWQEKQTYQITILPGIQYRDNFRSKDPIHRVVHSETFHPWLGFGYDEQFYFPRRSGLVLPLRSRNVSSANLTLYRLFPSNIAVALNDAQNGRGSWSFGRSWCEQVAQKRYSVNRQGPTLVETKIPLDELFGSGKRGVFCLEADAQEAPKATKVVLFTDIGLLAHWRDSELYVFVHDLYSLSPIEFAKITVYSEKNRLLAELRTDAEGLARVSNMNTAWGNPKVLVAEYGEDYTFLQLTPSEDNVPQIRSDMPSYRADAYDGFLYADRDLYRPGETVHLRWIVRTNYGDASANVPLQFVVLKPNGESLLREPVTLSSTGAGGYDFMTQDVYPTGNYVAQLKVPGSEAPIGSYSFRLEEFVPQRMKAEMFLSDANWLMGNDYVISVTATQLIGPPAVNRKVDAKIHLRKGTFSSRKFPLYYFGNDKGYKPETFSIGETNTDEHGLAQFHYTPPFHPGITYPIEAVISANVHEIGGRTVPAHARAILCASDILLGIHMAGRVGKSGLDVNVIAIHPDEAPAVLPSVTVTLEQQKWSYYLRRYYTHDEPSWADNFYEIETRAVPLQDGIGHTEFDPKGYGYFRVCVQSDATALNSTRTFYCYDGRCQLSDMAQPTLLKLSLDKEKYEIGEDAVLRVESPFDGCGIVVLQHQTIRSMIPIRIENQSGEIRIPITEEAFPNLWAEVTVVHAIEKDKAQLYPFMSFAVASIAVHNATRDLTLSMPGLPSEIRPNRETEIAIQVTDSSGNPVQSELTLAAVDEGIHLITDYKNPDPYAWLSRPRKPDLRRAHYYDRVVYQYEQTTPGGDMEADLEKRVAPPMESWIKPVALWSGEVRTDESGKATVRLAVPEFDGVLRLVAVGWNERAAGSLAQELPVRRPVMLRTSMPRFLLPGDSCECRAVIFNTTASPCRTTLRWIASGALKASSGSLQLAVPANSEKDCSAPIFAGDLSGQGQLDWTMDVYDEAGGLVETVTQSAPLPVKMPAAYQLAADIRVVKPSESMEIVNDRFLEDERFQINVRIGASPAIQLEKALSYLLDYPYGCVEQVTSRLMALYVLKERADLIQQRPGRLEYTPAYLQAGIDQLLAMQLPSGGLASWPSWYDPYPYGSIYAFHLLTLVKDDSSVQIPGNAYKLLKNYVNTLAGNAADSSESGLYQRAYALYTLSLARDEGAISRIAGFDAIPLPRAARYLLAAALALNTKEYDRVRMYMAQSPSEPYLFAEQDGTLNSEIRNDAVELLSLLQMNTDPVTLAERAERIAMYLRNREHYITHETAFAVTALGMYMKKIGVNTAAAMAEISYSTGVEPLTTRIQGMDICEQQHKGGGAKFIVKNTGDTNIYANVVMEGIPRDPIREAVSNGISMGRQYFTNRAVLQDSRRFKHGDDYVICLDVSCDQNLKNVVVVDLLPAGFEIMNPRLDADALPELDVISNIIAPTYTDIRDDRIILAFRDLPGGSRHYCYAVRAITPGNYQVPAVHAECMYDPLVQGSSAPETIEISR
ncbi:MAG TPA: MG2 domain-containing protein [bacterium]|nr:MG2 domain-containing protein [bacterium]HQL61605.1 MG2 domain-containing protein [bacterium]